MKNLIKTSFILLAMAAVFSACKKDPVDLENSYMTMIVSEDGVTAVENEVRYVANLSPGTLSGGEVTVTYSSGADPEGFSLEASYWSNELTFGRDVYNVQQIDRNFYVATETNADEKRLKVNPDGDKITITIGDNVFSETVDFVKKYDPLLVASITQGVSGGLHGKIYYYNETGERPTITAYSDSDPTPVSLTPLSDVGDNGYYASDAESGDDFGRTVYSISLIFDAEESSGYDYEVNVNHESDVLYVEIGDKTYSMPIENDDRFYQITMSPA
jgi:hypothetical protein